MQAARPQAPSPVIAAGQRLRQGGGSKARSSRGRKVLEAGKLGSSAPPSIVLPVSLCGSCLWFFLMRYSSYHKHSRVTCAARRFPYTHQLLQPSPVSHSRMFLWSPRHEAAFNALALPPTPGQPPGSSPWARLLQTSHVNGTLRYGPLLGLCSGGHPQWGAVGSPLEGLHSWEAEVSRSWAGRDLRRHPQLASRGASWERFARLPTGPAWDG